MKKSIRKITAILGTYLNTELLLLVIELHFTDIVSLRQCGNEHVPDPHRQKRLESAESFVSFLQCNFESLQIHQKYLLVISQLYNCLPHTSYRSVLTGNEDAKTGAAYRKPGA